MHWERSVLWTESAQREGGGAQGLHRDTGRCENSMPAWRWVVSVWLHSAKGSLQLGFQGLGFTVCLYLVLPIGGGPNDSWPYCVSLLAFSDLGPKDHRVARVLQRGQKTQVQEENEVRTGLCLSVCVCSFIIPRRVSVCWGNSNFPLSGHLQIRFSYVAEPSWCSLSTY